MNKQLALSLVLTLTACAPEARQPTAETRDALAAPGGDQCALVTLEALEELYGVIQTGLALAEQDAALALPDPASSTGLRDAFAAANARMEEHFDWHVVEGDADPLTINAHEATVTGHVALAVTADLMQAVQQGVTSAVNNKTNNARSAVEEAFLGVELANVINVYGLRCYLAYYGP